MTVDPTCPPEEVQQSRSELSAAYCALAEVYLTELWCEVCVTWFDQRSDEDTAQDTCLDCMRRALECDEHNAQAMQVNDIYSALLCEQFILCFMVLIV